MEVLQEPATTPFNLTPAQRALADEVRQLAASELRPLAEAGQPGRVNRELIQVMGRMGLLARLFPGAAAERGSRTVPATELCLLWEALATECTAAATVLVLQGLGTYPVLQFGPAEQIRRWLPAVAAGEVVAGLTLGEPGKVAGGREPAIELTAEPDGDDWVLNGEKTWVYNAPEADFYTVFARMPPGTGGSGIGTFLVPAMRPGLSGERLELSGTLPVGCLTFDGVPVVRDDLLGEPGQGEAVAARTSAAFRPSAGAVAAGIARAALEMAVEHTAAALVSGGQGGVRSAGRLLAEMATRTKAARLLVYAAAAARDAIGGPVAGQAAMAELFTTETAQFVVDAAMQLVGTEALRRGHPLQHLAREARATLLCQGPPDLRYATIVGDLAGLAPATAAGTPDYVGLASHGPGQPHDPSVSPCQYQNQDQPLEPDPAARWPGPGSDGDPVPGTGAEAAGDPEPAAGEPEPGGSVPEFAAGAPEPAGGVPELAAGPGPGDDGGSDGEPEGDGETPGETAGVGDGDGGGVEGHG